MSVGGDVLAGRYRLLRTIGRGGMGEVYLARDEMLDREVAVKHVLAGGFEEDQAIATQRLIREARSAARIHHPNVVTVHDLVVDGADTYIVMEYVPAENLAQILSRGPISPQRAALIGAQVCDGLAAAHELGIVHRDVKPSNILVAPGDKAKLTDFGVARVTGDTGLTKTGHMVGSIAYLAPEIARGRDATAAADIYSLGATLFAAVEGYPPFGEDRSSTSVGMLVRLVTETAPPATHAGLIAGVIARFLASEPTERPGTAEASTMLHDAATPGADAHVAPLLDEPDEDTVEATRIRSLIVAAVEEPAVAEPAPASVDRTILRAEISSAKPTAAPVLPELSPEPPVQPAVPAAKRPLTPIQRQDQRRRRALLILTPLVLLAVIGLIVLTHPAWLAWPATTQEDQLALRIGDTAYSQVRVRQIAQALADSTSDTSDDADEYTSTVVGTLIQNELVRLTSADTGTIVTDAERTKALDGNETLSRLAQNAVVTDFINEYATTQVVMSRQDFLTALTARAKTTTVWVNPVYGTWNQHTGELETPSPSASPS